MRFVFRHSMANVAICDFLCAKELHTTHIIIWHFTIIYKYFESKTKKNVCLFFAWVYIDESIMIICCEIIGILKQAATSKNVLSIKKIKHNFMWKNERMKIMLHRIRLFIDVSKIYFVRIHTYKYTFLPFVGVWFFSHPISSSSRFLRYVFVIIAL